MVTLLRYMGLKVVFETVTSVEACSAYLFYTDITVVLIVRSRFFPVNNKDGQFYGFIFSFTLSIDVSCSV